MYLRAMTGYEKIQLPEYISTLTIVRNIRILYLNQGKTKKAEEMFLKALTGY